MRRPQASFEAQPRIARLLAPKMGIGPYKSLTLEEVLEQLSARYDVRIITDAGDVGRTRFSGALETRLSVEQALDIVSRQTGMEWSKLDNVYFVTKR